MPRFRLLCVTPLQWVVIPYLTRGPKAQDRLNCGN